MMLLELHILRFIIGSFYATYFTVRAEDFDYCLMCKGENKVRKIIKEYEEKGTIFQQEKEPLQF